MFTAELLKKTEKKKEKIDGLVLDWKASIPTYDKKPDADGAKQCSFCKKWLQEQKMLDMHFIIHPTLIWEIDQFRIYLGSEVNAKNKIELQSLKIKYVLNVAADSKCFYPNEFTYLQISLADEITQNVLTSFPIGIDFIDSAKKDNAAILIHCIQGISRSASFVISYLMRANRWSLMSSLSYVRDKRSIVSPNRGFLHELLIFEIRENIFHVHP